MLFYFSLLSLLAKLLRRRVSDVLFDPTLIYFYFMHILRFELAQTGWLEFDGRIATVILSQDFDAFWLADFLATDAALRMNGNIKSLFMIKMVVLTLNLAPFLWSTSSKRSRDDVPPLEHENALAVRAVTIGGLGRPLQYESGLGNSDTKSDARGPALPSALPCYELVRLGYIVIGDRYLISVQEWCWFTLLSPVRSCQPFANFRVCVYIISESADGARHVQQQPCFINIGDIAWKSISCRDISLQSFR